MQENEEMEKTISNVLIQAFVSPSNEIDNFSTWIQAATAATIVLILTNIMSISEMLNVSMIKALVIILTISIGFGLAQKYMALLIEIEIKMFTQLDEKLKDVISQYAGDPVRNPYSYMNEHFNTLNIITRFLSSFPPYAKNKLIEGFIRKKDSNNVDSKIQRFLIQLILFTLQLASLFVAVGVFFCGI